MKTFFAFVAAVIIVLAGAVCADELSITTDITSDNNYATASGTFKAYDPRTVAGVNALFAATDESNMWLIALDSTATATGLNADTTAALEYRVRAGKVFPGVREDVYRIPDQITLSAVVGIWRPNSALATNFPASGVGAQEFDITVTMQGAESINGPWTTYANAKLDMTQQTSADSINATTLATGWYRVTETTLDSTEPLGDPAYVRFILATVAGAGDEPDNSHVWVRDLYFTRRFTVNN